MIIVSNYNSGSFSCKLLKNNYFDFMGNVLNIWYQEIIRKLDEVEIAALKYNL